jgi:hypothetical protein
MAENKKRLTDTKKIERLIQGIAVLSAADRSLILDRLKDPSIVIINDWLGLNRERPCAIILYSHDNWESIDILESIRNNAASVGHPAILCAIQRWEQVVLTQYPLARTQRQKAEAASWEVTHGSFKRTAKQHLKNIGKALLEAAENPKRRKSILTVFNTLLQRIDAIDVLYLKMAWKLLSENDIHYKSYGIDEDGKEQKKEQSHKAKLDRLKMRLITRFTDYGFGDEPFDPPLLQSYDQLPRKTKEDFLNTTAACFGPIFDFLSSEECRPFFGKRGKWATMRNSYIKWGTGLKKNTIKNYGSRLPRQTEKPVKIDFSFLLPDREGNNHYTLENTDAFLLPTISCSLATCPCRKRERRP